MLVISLISDSPSQQGYLGERFNWSGDWPYIKRCSEDGRSALLVFPLSLCMAGHFLGFVYPCLLYWLAGRLGSDFLMCSCAILRRAFQYERPNAPANLSGDWSATFHDNWSGFWDPHHKSICVWEWLPRENTGQKEVLGIIVKSSLKLLQTLSFRSNAIWILILTKKLKKCDFWKIFSFRNRIQHMFYLQWEQNRYH